MASNTALYTGLSSLNAHARRLDVVGNNIANSNTTAFKSSRVVFETRFSQNFKLGSSPSADMGGTNPGQIGLGVDVAGTLRDFSNGSLQATGDARDLAIEGDGFFVVRRGDQNFYTRDGGFRPDETDSLVTIGGDRLMGYPVDDGFNIIEGQLEPIAVPLGKLRLAEQTTEVGLAGNLNADGAVATQGGIVDLLGTASSGLRLTSGPLAASAPDLLLTTSLLTDIEDPLQPGTDAPLFAAGQSLSFSGGEKGSKTLPDASLEIEATTTVSDLLAFLSSALGIHSTTSANPDGATPGASLDPATGRISVAGNTGEANEINLNSENLRLLEADGSLNRLPFVADRQASATGESVRTTMVVYDSLGTAVEVDVSMTMVGKSLSGTTWRYDVQSPENLGQGLHLTSGEIQFDTFGQLVDDDPVVVSLSRAGSGAASPLVFDLGFQNESGRVTALSDTPSELAAVFRDGLPAGVLEDFAVAEDGVIQGAFSNGAIRTLGQVPLATFPNNEGLLDEGAGLFSVGANSGDAVVSRPGSLGSGVIVGGALELSNVDLGEEFIDLIVTQTGYNAASRIIQTTDELMQQLLVLGR
ncbi:MAG: flagellar hook-basal body complex protein [Planctomycetota bacterium]